MKNQMVDFIKSRKSIRDFTGEKVSDETLESIVAAGMSAPTAVNVQPWAFVIVTDKAKLAEMAAKLPYAKMLETTGSAIVVCGVPDKDAQFAKKYWLQDCSAATENILLAAHALGLGAVWTAVYPEEDRVATVRAACGLPESVIPLNVIPVGVPSKKNEKPFDKFKPDNIHRNVW